jgi:putative ABC transport system permease protein
LGKPWPRKNLDIIIIFLFNSALVGVVGGVIGVILGIGISSLIPTLGVRLMGAGMGGMSTYVSPHLIITVLLLSTGIGVVAGLVPSYRASKLQPVDALRCE